jgi:glutathione S-transferase
MPLSLHGRVGVTTWLFAALNSVEIASVPWSKLASSPELGNAPGWAGWNGLFKSRLQRLEPVLADCQWLVGEFSVADILMADVLRLPDRFDGLKDHPACRAYVARATARPAFAKAHADQIAHFAAADRPRLGRRRHSLDLGLQPDGGKSRRAVPVAPGQPMAVR